MTQKLHKREEVLFEANIWPHNPDHKLLPVTLIDHVIGRIPKIMSLHLQTGEGHAQALETAKKMLAERQLKVGDAKMTGPSGVYYEVTET